MTDGARTQEFAYIPQVRNGDQGSRLPARFPTTGGPDRWRTEAPLWAYCRELCGPAACDDAVSAILRELEDAPATINEDQLLLITRATAARFASAEVNGAGCAETPRRLAARACDQLGRDERRELIEHLATCLPCQAIKVKMGRAERGFATFFAGADELPAELDSGRAKAAALAYCRELCGPLGSTRAAAECLTAAGLEASSATVGRHELLRLTRTSAARQALIEADGQLGPENPSDPRDPECALTLMRLAAAANGDIEPVEQPKLERHLERCLVCQAHRIKRDRAERAFATEATVAAGTEPRYAGVASRAAGTGAAARTAAPTPADPSDASTAAAARPAPRRAAPAPLPRRRQRRARRLIAVPIALAAAAAAAAAVLAIGGTFSTTSAPPNLPAVAPTTPAGAAPIGAALAAGATLTSLTYNQAQAKPAPPRAPAKPHRAAKAHRPAAKRKPTAPGVAPAAPPLSAPVEPSAPVSAPVASQPSSPPPANPSTPSVTPQGTNLPPQSAPTQGIGSSGH